MKRLVMLIMIILLAMKPVSANAGVIGLDDKPLIDTDVFVVKALKQRGYTEKDLFLLASAMQLENGCNSDLCLLYTGSVILNRVQADWYADTIEGVLLQKGQYADHTVKNLYTTKPPVRVYLLAFDLLMHGSLDTEIIFQSMHPELGKVKYIIDGEYFATGR